MAWHPHTAHSSRPTRSAWSALVLVAALAAFPGLAGATVRYVSPTGSDANAGTSLATAWATITKANASLNAGDVCIVAPGNYANSINPAHAGTATARITYIGSPGQPSLTVVPGITIATGWVTVKGFSANNGGLFQYPARNDSMAFNILGSIQFNAGKYCMAAHNQINGRVAFLANNGSGCYDKLNIDAGCIAGCEQDTMRANTVHIGTIQPGDKGWQMRIWTQYCLVDSNMVTGTFDIAGSGTVDETFAFISFHSYYNTFRDNSWIWEATSDPPCANCNWDAFRMRDSSYSNTWTRDTFLVGLNSSHPIRWMFTASGDYPFYVVNHRWSQCIFKSKGSFWSQDRFANETIENSIIMSSGASALHLPFLENSTLRHNAFYSNGRTIWIEKVNGTSTDINSNIFYSTNAPPPSNTGGLTFWDNGATTGFTSNNNLFFTPTYSSKPGDRSLTWCCWPYSAPGAGTGWYGLNGQDGASRYGSPRFADSTFTNFNPALMTGSLAKGIGAGGTDAGPYIGPDVTPPATVANLDSANVSDKDFLLSWTQPGDDGNSGRVSTLDLRWSTSPITTANFGSATPVLPAPTIVSGGTRQVLSLTGLTPGASYYYALRATDESGNVSGLSNVLHVVMDPYDMRPPAAVSDLKTGP